MNQKQADEFIERISFLVKNLSRGLANFDPLQMIRDMLSGYIEKDPAEKEHEPFAKIGDRFIWDTKRGGEAYILCVVNSKCEVNLLCLDDGCRFSDPIEVHDMSNITEDEFKQLTEHHFDKFTKI